MVPNCDSWLVTIIFADPGVQHNQSQGWLLNRMEKKTNYAKRVARSRSIVAPGGGCSEWDRDRV